MLVFIQGWLNRNALETARENICAMVKLYRDCRKAYSCLTSIPPLKYSPRADSIE